MHTVLARDAGGGLPSGEVTVRSARWNACIELSASSSAPVAPLDEKRDTLLSASGAESDTRPDSMSKLTSPAITSE